jgi:hypothetical protein
MTRGRCDRLCLTTWGSCIPSSKPVHPGAPIINNNIGMGTNNSAYALTPTTPDFQNGNRRPGIAGVRPWPPRDERLDPG